MVKCINSDKPRLLEFLKRNPGENCFMIGDMENFDFEEDFIDFWKSEKDGEIQCLLMRYFSNYHISAVSDECFSEIAEIVSKDTDALTLNGLQPHVEKMENYLPFHKEKKNFLAELTESTFSTSRPAFEPQRATADHIEELFEFQKSIEEFNIDERNRKSFGTEIRTGTGKTCFIREKGRIVSSATVTAENSCNGMIVGVASDKNFRKKGYARACVGKLCADMVSSGKSVLLFYNNPLAGRLYKDLGFRDINNWMMAWLQKQDK